MSQLFSLTVRLLSRKMLSVLPAPSIRPPDMTGLRAGAIGGTSQASDTAAAHAGSFPSSAIAPESPEGTSTGRVARYSTDQTATPSEILDSVAGNAATWPWGCRGSIPRRCARKGCSSWAPAGCAGPAINPSEPHGQHCMWDGAFRGLNPRLLRSSYRRRCDAPRVRFTPLRSGGAVARVRR